MLRWVRYLLLLLVAAGLIYSVSEMAISQSSVSLATKIGWGRGQGKIEGMTMCANGTDAWIASIGPGALDDLFLFKLTGVNTASPKLTGDTVFFGDNDDFVGEGKGFESAFLPGPGSGLPAGMGPRGYPGVSVDLSCRYAYVPSFFLDSVVKVDMLVGAAKTAASAESSDGTVSANDGTILWPANYAIDHLNSLGDSLLADALRTMPRPVDARLNTPAETKVIVSSSKEGAVYILDSATGDTLAKIPTGGVGSGSIVVSGNAWAGVVESSRDVACIDLSTNKLVNKITGLGINPFMAVAGSDGSTIYVSNQGSKTVSVLSGSGCNKSVAATIDVGHAPRHLALSPDNRFLYVSNSLDNTVSVIDTGSLSVVETIGVGGQGQPAPVGEIAVTNDNRYLYVFWEGGIKGPPGKFEIWVFDVSGLYKRG